MTKINCGAFILLFFIFMTLSVYASEGRSSDRTLMMATTTSTDNTGLLDYLSPYFTKSTGIEFKWTAVGTGKALALGQNCDVDILMVHDPVQEAEFMKKGYGVDRRPFMYNDFVIIGPLNDPFGIKGKKLLAALEILYEKKTLFVSRGDKSGTHEKERLLWKMAGLLDVAKQKWYRETGQGMLATIRISSELKGYTLADRGSYIKYEDAMKEKLDMAVLIEKDEILNNQYSVISVNPRQCSNSKIDLARKFSDWITGRDAQVYIENFTLLGKQLFVPNAKN